MTSKVKLGLAPCWRVNVFSIGKQFSNGSTMKVDCGSIFFHRHRQTLLSGLLSTNHRHGLSRRQNNDGR